MTMKSLRRLSVLGFLANGIIGIVQSQQIQRLNLAQIFGHSTGLFSRREHNDDNDDDVQELNRITRSSPSFSWHQLSSDVTGTGISFPLPTVMFLLPLQPLFRHYDALSMLLPQLQGSLSRNPGADGSKRTVAVNCCEGSTGDEASRLGGFGAPLQMQ